MLDPTARAEPEEPIRLTAFGISSCMLPELVTLAMIHHVPVGANNLNRARAFYDPVMQILGFRLLNADEESVDYGIGEVMFSAVKPKNGQPASPGNGTHIAFAARDRHMVQEFHRLALAQGGTEDGPPGLRPEYDANYYGAFVRDLDDNKVEAVTYSAK